MKIIPLTNKQFAIVDDEDFEYLSHLNWSAAKDGRCWYASTAIYNPITKIQRSVSMSRYIMLEHLKEGLMVDHINGDGLDNRKCNLRVCTNAENGRNRRLSLNNKSGFKGVFWLKNEKRWVVQIKINQKMIYFGRHKSKIKAAKIYDEAAKKFHGPFARLNFP